MPGRTPGLYLVPDVSSFTMAPQNDAGRIPQMTYLCMPGGHFSIAAQPPSGRPRTPGRVVGCGLRLSDRGLSATRAAAARVGGFSLLAVLVYVADEYPAIYARAGTL